mgnify:CR=1 FL=1|jgi:hypothetical protein
MISSVREYRCDNLTHLFGLLFPILVIRECKSSMVVALSIFMFLFHVMTIAVQER